MKLIGTMNSPYVKRVAISLELYGLAGECEPLSVFTDVDAFAAFNPVLKAPTLLLDDGTRLMDSTLILNYFESTTDKEHKLLPVRPQELADDLALLGLILVAAEKAVQYVSDRKLRPTETPALPWSERVTSQLHAACEGWNDALKQRLHHETPDQVIVSGNVVWNFIKRQLPGVIDVEEFSHIDNLTRRFDTHPAFEKYSRPQG